MYNTGTSLFLFSLYGLTVKTREVNGVDDSKSRSRWAAAFVSTQVETLTEKLKEPERPIDDVIRIAEATAKLISAVKDII